MGFIKNTVKDNTNMKGWVGWNAIKNNTSTIAEFIKDKNMVGATSSKKMTFDEAMQHYGLSDKDIQDRMKSRLRSAILCFSLGLIAFGWMFFLLFKGLFLSCLVALALSGLMFSYAFREHFYYFKMKQKKLDCTFREWLSGFSQSK